jgi:hypothetical protein
MLNLNKKIYLKLTMLLKKINLKNLLLIKLLQLKKQKKKNNYLKTIQIKKYQ